MRYGQTDYQNRLKQEDVRLLKDLRTQLSFEYDEMQMESYWLLYSMKRTP